MTHYDGENWPDEQSAISVARRNRAENAARRASVDATPPADAMEAARKIIGWVDNCAADVYLLVPQVSAEIEKRAAEAWREAIKECAVKLEDEARRKLSSQYNKNRYEDGAQFHHAAAIVRALAEQQPLRETAPPEHPTEAMIEAGVRMHQEPRGGPPETLVHDIYQAMYDAWRAAQP